MKSSYNPLSEDGNNLTIAILSYNSSDITIELLESIFKNEKSGKFKVTILNQGSSMEENRKLNLAAREFQIEVKTIERNLGIPSGRNHLLSICRSDWVLFLDSDLIFKGMFLKELSEETRKNGDFISLIFQEGTVYNPKLAVKSVLYLGADANHKKTVGLGGIPASQEPKSVDIKPAIAGGVFLANTESLRKIGGFRGPGLVGYEDLELTLRAYKSNVRITHANLATPIFHFKRPQSFLNQKTTRAERLDPLELRVNARFIELHHGVKVWNLNQHLWAYESLKAIGLEKDLAKMINPFLCQKASTPTLPTVLLVADQPGWALDRIAQQMKKHLSQDFNFVILYSKNWEQLCSIINLAHWNAIIFLWRNPLFLMMRERAISESTLTKTSFIVYDHQGWMGFEKEAFHFKAMKNPIGAVNENLTSTLRSQSFVAIVTPDGVNPKLFYPPHTARKIKNITIGWAGNTKWGGVDDNKGFRKVIKPLVEAIDPQVFNFQIMDASRGKLPQRIVANAMRSWDILICTSEHEGTPNPIIEGMATSLYLISTPVGMTPELNQSGAKIKIIGRSHEEFANAIEEYYKSERFQYLPQKDNYQASIHWRWEKVLQNHKYLIDSVLEINR
jgi:GT2 family glycosyltransferase